MNEREFGDRVRGLLAERDRAKRGQLFRPDRGIEADARFIAAVRDLAQDYAEAERERIRIEVRRLQDELADAKAANRKFAADYAKALGKFPSAHEAAGPPPATMVPPGSESHAKPRTPRQPQKRTPATPRASQRRTAPPKGTA